MSNYAPYTTAAAVTAGVLGSAYCAYHIFRESRKTRIPTEWTQVGSLDHIYTYPIKSCGPVILDTGECTTLGLRDGWLRDRALMVVDEKSNYVSAANYPQLLIVQATVRNSILTLKHRDMEPVYVNLAEVVALQSPKAAAVRGVTVPVLDCGWEVSEWFSRLLDRSSINFRLVYHATKKPAKPLGNTFYKFTEKDTGAFPEEIPYCLINEASVDDLNTRLKTCQLTYCAFRPNFVVRTSRPLDEDHWKFLKIGDNIFEVLRPCTRSVFTTIDPETGVFKEEEEPLDTLKSYRRRSSADGSPRMGLQMALRTRTGSGQVKLCDPVFAA